MSNHMGTFIYSVHTRQILVGHVVVSGRMGLMLLEPLLQPEMNLSAETVT